jgi:DNA-binding PadR family transcriptional regulator
MPHPAMPLRPLDRQVLWAIASLAAQGTFVVTPMEVATALAERGVRRLHLVTSGVLYRTLAKLTDAGLLARLHDPSLPAGVAGQRRWRYALTTAGRQQLTAGCPTR